VTPVQPKLSVSNQVIRMGRSARSASRSLTVAPTSQKNDSLRAIANEIRKRSKTILHENAMDMESANKQGLSIPLLDRLELTPERIDLMADGVNRVADLSDPVGEISGLKRQASGIEVGRMRVPLGVIGIIFESRPNVTADAAALCIKSGNAAILRGGSEALRSNLAIADCVQRGLSDAGLPKESIQAVQISDRTVVGELLQLRDYVDVIIPRGGRELVERVIDKSKIPVLRHLDGNCHVYIDQSANIDQAVAIAYNAKCRRYGICGAMETLLLSKDIADVILKKLLPLYYSAGVELRVCPEAKKLISQAKDATEQDWYTEYLAPILAVRVVDNIDDALDHIARYGSGHTDSIVTEDLSATRRFLREVDSSSVMVNASTQFADGFEYGLGAEIGISTEKLHARGPVGLEGLTTQKFIVIGDGSVRA